MEGILKRKFADVDDNPRYSSSPPSSLSSPGSSEWESDGEGSLFDNQDFTPHSPSPATTVPTRSILRRSKLSGTQSNVRFDQVLEFSFPLCQGFTSVPSHGGATLGMRQRHNALQRYTVAEHCLQQRHRRRERLRERRREDRFQTLKHKLITSGAIDQREADGLTSDQMLRDDTDVHISDADLESGVFLLPYSSKQRQALLLAAGVKRIDREEKRQLHALRLSREACGCDCRGFCEPETCACSLAGIKCQVDRFNFPCGCTKDGCGNTQGRTEFNSRRVRTHYIHTTMKLEMERRLQDENQSKEDQAGRTEEYRDQDQACEVQSPQDKICPFGLNVGDDGLSLTVPVTPSFHLIPERMAVEENSCSSDTTESSHSSSDSDPGGCLNVTQNLSEVDGGLSRVLSISDNNNNNNNNYSSCSQLRHISEALTQHDGPTSTDPDCASTFTDSISCKLTEYLDENANQARDIFNDDSLDGFPNTPSPTVDYSSGSYMDLSLSSDSDLEFFDSDYTSGPLHSSFKLHRHPDNLCHLQLLSSVQLPQHESSTYLLESLIGLTEPNTEQSET